MNRRIFISLLLLLSPFAARADSIGYGGTHEVTANQGKLTFHHVHNWDSPKVDELFSDLTHHERFFSTANDFAFVELRDGDSLLFRSPSPALTYLWISPDAQYLVGLSRVMLRNPYQLVVWRRDGTIVHREHIASTVAKLSQEQRKEFTQRFPEAEKFLSGRYFEYGKLTYLDFSIGGVPNNIGHDAWSYLHSLRVRHPYAKDFSESVTNWVDWFDKTNPDVGISLKETTLTLSLRSRTGSLITIPIK